MSRARGAAVTAAFVHADFWHLAGNMIFLLATGPFLEDAYGRVLFPVIYLGSAISGCYAWGELGAGRSAWAIGASGAIFGVEGAFAVRFGTRYLRFFLAPVGFLPFLGFRIRVRAAIVLLFGFLEQLLLLGSEGSHDRLRRSRGRIRVRDAGRRRRLGRGISKSAGSIPPSRQRSAGSSTRSSSGRERLASPGTWLTRGAT